MAWWLWLLVVVLALPLASALLGGVLLLLSLLIPTTLLPKQCGCCARTGAWSRRNSLGAFICDACAEHGAHVHAVERYDL